MRSEIIIAAAASALLASAESFTCGRSISQELSQYVSCGDKDAISQCFEGGSDLVDLANIEYCLMSSGCSKTDASDEALWITSACGSAQGWAEEADGELRKRATTEETTTTAESTSNTKKSSTESTTSDATTTSESSTTSTSSTSSTSSASTASSTSASSSSSSSSSSSTGSSSTTSSDSSSSSGSSNTCLATNIKTTSSCVTTSDSTSCSQFVSTASSCAAGKICTTNASDSTVCMDKHDDLTTSGLIVTIGLAIFIVSFFATMIIMSAKENRERAENKAAAEALLSGDMKVSSTSSATYVAINNDNNSVATKPSPLIPLRLSLNRSPSDSYESLDRPTITRNLSSSSMNIAPSARAGGYSGITNSDGDSPTTSEHGSVKGRPMV